MLGSLKFAVLQFADFHFPQNPRIARTPCIMLLMLILSIAIKILEFFASSAPKKATQFLFRLQNCVARLCQQLSQNFEIGRLTGVLAIRGFWGK